MRESVDGYNTGITRLNNTLDDLDVADDIGLLSDSSTKMQVKTERLSSVIKKAGLIISYEEKIKRELQQLTTLILLWKAKEYRN